MMNAPFFSIIIPCYNSADSISEALQSIIQQRCTDLEVLIMDGASKDETLSVIKAFGDTRIKIYSEPDQGIYDAMNKGILRATGQWLYFLGSDDYLFDENVLSDIQSFIAVSASEVVYGDVKVKGEALWARDGEIYGGKFDFYNLYKKNICHQSIFYNRQFVLRNGFYCLRYPVSADWDFNFRCWQKTKFTYIARIVAVFQAGGLSTIKDIKEPFHQERRKYLPLRVRITERVKKLLKYFLD